MRRRTTQLATIIAACLPLVVPRMALAQGDGDAPAGEEAPTEEAPAEEEAPPAEDAPPGDDGWDPALGPNPRRKPPKGMGAVVGVLKSEQTGDTLLEAPVAVEGRKEFARTNFDGVYRIELPPGTYTLRFRAELHEAQRVQVTVVAGELQTLDVTLEAIGEIEETVIVSEADKASIEGLTIKRKRAAAVGDSIGRTEINKNPDSNAATATRRVPGATVVGGRFVYVRGLGERYTNALLNGAPLPSPEPDRAAVPLDLFPAQVLESLTIAKTFTPDVPGDFAGGSVQIETRGVPSEFLFSASLSLGYNTQATFRDRLGYRGSSTDWLGFDSGLRALPDSVPDDYALASAVERPDGTLVDNAELDARGRDINTFMSTQRKFTPLNHSMKLVVGDGWKLGGDSKFGYVAAINYSRSYQILKGPRRVFEDDDTSPTGARANIDFDWEEGSYNVNWGAFLSLNYEADENNSVRLIGLHTQIADDTTTSLEGPILSQTQDEVFHTTRLAFVSRALNSAQLIGNHEFPDANGGALDWNATYSVASRNQPDTRDVVYKSNFDQDRWSYVDGAESGRHFFSDQSERAVGAGLDYTQPLIDGPRRTVVKAGGLVNLKSRDFGARRLALRRSDAPEDSSVFLCNTVEYSEKCPDPLFVPDNIGPNLRLEEGTQAQDAYDAKLNVFAWYFMGDVAITRDLRLILGERVEVTRQTIEPFDQFATGANVEGADLNSTDLLPSASLVYSATEKAKLRFAVSRTLARPQLRELAPFTFSNFFLGRNIAGNPDLELTKITNGDLRFEYFPTLAEVLAVSVFYKQFDGPIEPVEAPGTDAGFLTFQNAEGATLIGLELEGRVGMGLLDDALDDFTFISNLTLSRSRIEVMQTDRNFLTNLNRPMANQSPIVINLAVDWQDDNLGANARVLYNYLHRRLVRVGSENLDDTYEHPLHTLDVVVGKRLGDHFKLKLTAQNLINPEVHWTLGTEKRESVTVWRYRLGQTYSLSGSYTF